MKSGSVSQHVVAHGKGSDPNGTGFVERFSNVSGSNASSQGFYLASETYQGKHGLSLRLDGLSSTNNQARARAVVIHAASYVSDGNSKQGRSWGCPALEPGETSGVISRLKGKSLIYAAKSTGRDIQASDPDPTPSPSPSGGTQCKSATLGRMVDAGTCVESRSDREWYNCVSGSWKRGKTNCTDTFPLGQ
jgi:hypothetical protein